MRRWEIVETFIFFQHFWQKVRFFPWDLNETYIAKMLILSPNLNQNLSTIYQPSLPQKFDQVQTNQKCHPLIADENEMDFDSANPWFRIHRNRFPGLRNASNATNVSKIFTILWWTREIFSFHLRLIIMTKFLWFPRFIHYQGIKFSEHNTGIFQK